MKSGWLCDEQPSINKVSAVNRCLYLWRKKKCFQNGDDMIFRSLSGFLRLQKNKVQRVCFCLTATTPDEKVLNIYTYAQADISWHFQLALWGKHDDVRDPTNKSSSYLAQQFRLAHCLAQHLESERNLKEDDQQVKTDDVFLFIFSSFFFTFWSCFASSSFCSCNDDRRLWKKLLRVFHLYQETKLV